MSELRIENHEHCEQAPSEVVVQSPLPLCCLSLKFQKRGQKRQ
jgi:hypothetical protein